MTLEDVERTDRTWRSIDQTKDGVIFHFSFPIKALSGEPYLTLQTEKSGLALKGINEIQKFHNLLGDALRLYFETLP